jgi:hypothetical protein
MTNTIFRSKWDAYQWILTLSDGEHDLRLDKATYDKLTWVCYVYNTQAESRVLKLMSGREGFTDKLVVLPHERITNLSIRPYTSKSDIRKEIDSIPPMSSKEFSGDPNLEQFARNYVSKKYRGQMRVQRTDEGFIVKRALPEIKYQNFPAIMTALNPAPGKVYSFHGLEELRTELAQLERAYIDKIPPPTHLNDDSDIIP